MDQMKSTIHNPIHHPLLCVGWWCGITCNIVMCNIGITWKMVHRSKKESDVLETTPTAPGATTLWYRNLFDWGTMELYKWKYFLQKSKHKNCQMILNTSLEKLIEGHGNYWFFVYITLKPAWRLLSTQPIPCFG